jgi:pimeloyl-ACP methyl ester carboxylesterase
MRRALALILTCFAAGCSDSADTDPQPSPDAGFDEDANADAEIDTSAPDEPKILFMVPAETGTTQATEAFYGTPFHVVVEGLDPGESVTAKSRFWGYEGWAAFVADPSGVVDTSNVAPTKGSYEGVDPDGLVWSMELLDPTPGSGYDVDIEVTRGSGDVIEASFVRHPMGLGSLIENFEGEDYSAKAYRPDADGRFPTVVVLGGSEGGLPLFQAAWFATFGFVGVAVGYFGLPGLPSSLLEVDVQGVGRALDHIKTQPYVDPEKIVLWGGSRGSELALMAGSRLDGVRGVIVEAPSGLRWASVHDPDAPAWTVDGAGLPFMPYDPKASPEAVMGPDGKVAWATTKMFLDNMAYATQEQTDAATIEVESIDGPVLLLAGGDDQMWPSCALSEVAIQRRSQFEHSALLEDRVVCFPEAGHALGPPGWPTSEMAFVPIGGRNYALGGTPGGTARAQRQVYLETREFLDRVLQ